MMRLIRLVRNQLFNMSESVGETLNVIHLLLIATTGWRSAVRRVGRRFVALVLLTVIGLALMVVQIIIALRKK